MNWYFILIPIGLIALGAVGYGVRAMIQDSRDLGDDTTRQIERWRNGK